MKKNKGFTLIELLVVIAIIGILASVVLASLNSARDKGANASIKSNLVNMRAQAALVFDDSNPNSYETLCSNSNVTTAVGEAEKAAGTTGAVKCYGDIESWVIVSPLKVAEDTSTHYCVDSTGKSVGIDTAQYTNITTTNTSTVADVLCS